MAEPYSSADNLKYAHAWQYNSSTYSSLSAAYKAQPNRILARVKNPSKNIMEMDSYPQGTGKCYYYIGQGVYPATNLTAWNIWIHGNKTANFSFVDGHAANIRYNEFLAAGVWAIANRWKEYQ